MGDHRREILPRDVAAAILLGEGHHPDRQRGPRADAALRLHPVGERPPPVASASAEVEPHQFGRSAADIEHQGEVGAAVEQRRAARHGEPRLGLGRQQLDLEAHLVTHTLEELGAVLGDAAGLRRHEARSHDLCAVELGGADAQGVDGPRHRRLREAPGAAHPLAEADDAGEGVDDEEATPRGAGDQEPTIVGAEIESAIAWQPAHLRLVAGGTHNDASVSAAFCRRGAGVGQDGSPEPGRCADRERTSAARQAIGWKGLAMHFMQRRRLRKAGRCRVFRHPCRSLRPRRLERRRPAAVATLVSALIGTLAGLTAHAEPLLDQQAGQRLVAAYPEHLLATSEDALVWRDGTRMPLRVGLPPTSPEEILAANGVGDMFHWPYPAGVPLSAPPSVADPGRARHKPFFDRMYGACERGEVARHLVEVVWLPGRSGQRLRVTRINGVADRLRAVSRALDRLPPRFDRFLVPAAGTYHCRPIAGTNRPSPHGYGIAIDIAVAGAHYWRWDRSAGAPAVAAWRNAIPVEIVAAFEREGFVWGGRWSHYDTMHFEYRPELSAAGSREEHR